MSAQIRGERGRTPWLSQTGIGPWGQVRGIVAAIAVSCLLLLAMLTVAQVAHHHASDTDADHCQLCIAMHTLAPVAAAATVVVMVRVGASTPQAVPAKVARQRYSRIFIRPPPFSC